MNTSTRYWGRWLGAALLAATIGAAPATAQCPPSTLCRCTGDCTLDGEVDISELQGCVNGFLGDVSCDLCDADLDLEVSIAELQGAVNGFLDPEICPPVALAKIEVGAVAGPRGTTVQVPINLSAHLDDVVTIAPLRLGFDANKLTFVSCNSQVASKTAVADSPAAGQLSVVLYANPFAQPAQQLVPIPVGNVINCSFAINAAAAVGPTGVAFNSAGLSDIAFNDITAEGSDGSVTIQ